MHRLLVHEFRSYQSAELEIAAAPVVLTGANGAGKTNLLEAISFLSPGRGLRGAKLSEVDRIAPADEAGGAATAWAVAAGVTTPEGPRDLGSGRDPGNGEGASGRERRLVKIDGAVARGQQALAEVLSMVWLTPQMDGLFRDSAGGRRRFLDRLVYGFDPEHSARSNAYEHALRERARLLKSGRGDKVWFDALEDSMARHGVAIADARLTMVERLQHACDAADGPFPKARLALEGTVEQWLGEGHPALTVEDLMRERLAESRRQDAEAGGAAVGPHRSDLAAQHAAKGVAAALCSTGEQKALLIAILLAHARLQALERGSPPLLLLDEVAAHLDAERRAALYREILDMRAQAWLTGTDAADFKSLEGEAQFFTIQDGGIRPRQAGSQ
ncbi:DNA replication/repair protein RecF [Pelagibius litoralis]|uniref:DNA replication and repair protein RecF n=1 Tax=Pelagibius litoralis TaxID=374515 RepID=A0A967CB54_9PROT|nr:DNA replication/repair protein RecF [Pelagibius litoralis]